MSFWSSIRRNRLDTNHPINRGLVLWYPLLEMAGSKVYDLSLRNYTGTFNGTPVWTGSDRGSGIRFNGTDAFIDTGNNTAFNFANTTFSVSGVFSMTSTANTYIVSNMGASNIGGWGIGITNGGTAGKFGVVVKNTSATSNCLIRESNTSVNDGKWHTFTAVITIDNATSGNNTCTIYIDGKVDQAAATVSGVSDGTTATSLTVGRRVFPTYYVGSAYGIRIHNRALTALEALQLHNNPFIGLAENRQPFIPAAGATATNRQYSFVTG